MKVKAQPDSFQELAETVQRIMWAEHKRTAQRFEEHSLTIPQFYTLVAIARRESGCPIGLLAGEMQQSNATMTGIVDRLETQKLVKRKRLDPDDRRKVNVELTAAGYAMLARARETRLADLRRALEAFPPRDRQEFLRLLKLYLAELEKEIK
jgi:DNA-binding MarR family transcriptional regulator